MPHPAHLHRLQPPHRRVARRLQGRQGHARPDAVDHLGRGSRAPARPLRQLRRRGARGQRPTRARRRGAAAAHLRAAHHRRRGRRRDRHQPAPRLRSRRPPDLAVAAADRRDRPRRRRRRSRAGRGGRRAARRAGAAGAHRRRQRDLPAAPEHAGVGSRRGPAGTRAVPRGPPRSGRRSVRAVRADDDRRGPGRRPRRADRPRAPALVETRGATRRRCRGRPDRPGRAARPRPRPCAA